MDVKALFDPFRNEFKGRFHAGEDMPGPTGLRKFDMIFLSGDTCRAAGETRATRSGKSGINQGILVAQDVIQEKGVTLTTYLMRQRGA